MIDIIDLNMIDASGNPVTQQIQSVAVTDASGNPVTGIVLIIQIFYFLFTYFLNCL